MRWNSRTFRGILHFFKNIIAHKNSFQVFNRFNIYFSTIFIFFYIFLITIKGLQNVKNIQYKFKNIQYKFKNIQEYSNEIIKFNIQ